MVYIEKQFVLAAVLATSLSNPAQAMTGNQLHQKCSHNDSFYQAQCFNYVMGVVDAATEVFYSLSQQHLCLPETATAGQIESVVKKYLQEHPEHRHLNGAVLTFTALILAFPCKGGQ